MADLLCPVVIGREAETDALRSALAAAGDGAGRLMFLAGEAGIGKSRLAAELAAEARARGAAGADRAGGPGQRRQPLPAADRGPAAGAARSPISR